MRRILLLLAALLVLVPIPWVAAAAPAQAQRATFGIRPASATGPDERPNLSYSGTPGVVVHDFVAVSNVGTDPITLRVYASDAVNTAEGGFDLLAGNRKPVALGAWTTVGAASVTVAGRSTEIVPVTLTVPADATPGDHVGGVVASLTTQGTDATGKTVSLEQRVGTRIYLRLSGDLRPKLEIDGLTAAYQAGTSPFGAGVATVSYTIRNSGNVRLSGKQTVRVATPWGSTVDVKVNADLPELLPGNALRVTGTASPVLPAGWLTAAVHLTPSAPELYASTADLAAVDAQVTFAAVPWTTIAIIAGLVGVAVLAWLLRRRRRTPTQVVPAESNDKAPDLVSRQADA